MNEILKQKLKSIYHNLSKLTNNPKLFDTQTNFNDIVNGTIHLNKLFNYFIMKLSKEKDDDKLISIISEFKDLNGSKLFNDEGLQKIRKLIPVLRKFINEKNKKELTGGMGNMMNMMSMMNMGDVNQNIGNLKEIVNQSIQENSGNYIYHIYKKYIDSDPKLSPDKEPDNFDKQYFSLWAMEKQNPALSKQLDSLVLMIDNFDIVLETFSPLIEEVKDLGMEMIEPIPGIGTINFLC